MAMMVNGYKYHVQLSAPGTVEMANWCKENCEDDDFFGSNRSVLWLFNNETDATAFKLMWL